jgi:hypothetical protein
MMAAIDPADEAAVSNSTPIADSRFTVDPVAVTAGIQWSVPFRIRHTSNSAATELKSGKTLLEKETFCAPERAAPAVAVTAIALDHILVRNGFLFEKLAFASECIFDMEARVSNDGGSRLGAGAEAAEQRQEGMKLDMIRGDSMGSPDYYNQIGGNSTEACSMVSIARLSLSFERMITFRGW